MSNIFKNPTDGWNSLERQIQKELVICVYCYVCDPINKLILMASYENDYSEEDIAGMLGISQEAVSKRLTKTLEHIRTIRKSGQL